MQNEPFHPSFPILIAILALTASISGCVETRTDDGIPLERGGLVKASDNSYSDGEVQLTAFAGYAIINHSESISSFYFGRVDDPWNTTVHTTSEQTVLEFLAPETDYLLRYETGTRSNELQFTTPPRDFGVADHESALVFPGSSLSGCTVAAVLRDGLDSNWFALIAGHCFADNSVGEVAVDRFANEIGVYVARHVSAESGGPTADWGIVRLFNETRVLSNPQNPMIGGPTALGDPNHVHAGELGCMQGQSTYGRQLGQFIDRCGPISQSYGYFVDAFTIDYAGDSGAPLIHAETGEILGLLVGLSVRGATNYYILCHALHDMERFNLELALLTAPMLPSSPHPLHQTADALAPLVAQGLQTEPCPERIMDRHAMMT